MDVVTSNQRARLLAGRGRRLAGAPLVLIATVVVTVTAFADNKKPPPKPAPSASASASGSASVASAPPPPPIPGAMISVAPGSVAMDVEDRQGNKSKKTFAVAAFEIETTEVTVAAFKACVDAGTCDAPEQDKDGAQDGCTYWKRQKQPSLAANCVSHEQATKYCQSVSRRLPTEPEWEYAAAGTDGRLYPWGSDAPVDNLCWSGGKRNDGTFTYRRAPCAVGSVSGDKSPFGVLDMAGNLREWVDPATGAYAYQRGGSYQDNVAESVRIGQRMRQPARFAWEHSGFRCARTRATTLP